ncbi:M16 family metallopeptidase [Maricaulis parjimensis]|uniref:M16 family metallopeptidase n=1 Tax=Maricaulis parjimensis TaxID=144023 RepID=UPI00193A76AD|nr:pitrilysin family protein [Maricaulis parjimensis]
MKNTLIHAALSAACLALLALPAQAQVHEQPAIGEPVAFELPETRNFSLENGLDVTFIPFGLAPTVDISLQVRAGNIDDGSQTWIADLTGAMMEEGAGGRSKAEIAELIASMGGSINVGVGTHTTTLSTGVLSQYGPDALALLADVAQRPNLEETEFERVRANLVRNVDVSRAQPGSIATEAYRRLLFGADHPYGNILPSEEQLRGYTMEDVQAFYTSHFGAGRARLYVAGHFDPVAMEAAVREAFSDWSAGAPDAATPALAQPGPTVMLIDRPDAPQTTLRLGFPTAGLGSEDEPELTVMNALLGGSFTSRLVRNLREDKGYTYSPGSSSTWMLDGGIWTFNADVTAADTAAALRETFYEIERLQTETPEHEEAQGIRNWLAGIFILQNASTGGLIGQVSRRDLFGLPADYLDQYVPDILAVSDEAISQTARDYLPLDQMTLVLVGDLALIEEDVLALPQLAGADILRPDAD